MTTIYVDADACPVKDETVKVAERHGAPVILVSNSGMRPTGHPLVSQIVVAEGADAADDWIAERIGVGDICVTQDIPLAKRCLEATAAAIGPGGRLFTTEGIGMAMAMRDLSQHLRETGTMTPGGRGFTREDRSRFLNELENLVRKQAKR